MLLAVVWALVGVVGVMAWAIHRLEARERAAVAELEQIRRLIAPAQIAEETLLDTIERMAWAQWWARNGAEQPPHELVGRAVLERLAVAALVAPGLAELQGGIAAARTACGLERASVRSWLESAHQELASDAFPWAVWREQVGTAPHQAGRMERAIAPLLVGDC